MSSSDSQAQQIKNDDYFVLRVVEPPGSADPFYPRTNPEGSHVAFTYEDGPPRNIRSFPARSLAVIDPIRSTTRAVMSFDDITAQILITQHRTVMFSPQYERAGMPSPGVVSILMWLFRKRQIRNRTQGTVLVGHLPHNRVTELSVDRNELLMTTSSPLSPRPLLVQVEFRSKVDADAALLAMTAEGAAASPPPPI